MRILVAEDDPVTAHLVEGILRRSAHVVTVVRTGTDAFAKLKEQQFDVLITDWMMPEMDGIELIRKVRVEIKAAPAILVTTTLSTPAARQHAIQSGADWFLAKPVAASELLAVLRQTQAQLEPAPAPAVPAPQIIALDGPTPPVVAVAIATSTGGPDALRVMFKSVTPLPDVAYFVVVHGPGWMQHTCAEVLRREVPGLNFEVATNGVIPMARCVYLAPGDSHLVVKRGTFALALSDGPPINFLRPAADPLFQSVATAFSSYGIGVVLTGLGSDGALGATAIAGVGGRVFVQDPTSAVAPSMPSAARRAVPACTQLPLDGLGQAVTLAATSIAGRLRSARR